MSSKIKKHSFTIIELAVIATIIALFAGLTIAYFGSVNRYSRDAKRKADMDAIRKAILVQSSMGSKPFPEEPAWCCLGGTGAQACNNLKLALNGFISSIPSDPYYSPASMTNCYMFKSGSDYFEMYASLEDGGVISFNQDTKVFRDAKAKYDDCPEGWISAPGFCVMKYEARDGGQPNCKDAANNSINCPVSVSNGYPWLLDKSTAEAACRSSGAHLISNAEWMAIARDIESVDANWIGGKNGSLKQGNVGATLGTPPASYGLGSPDTGITYSLAELALSNGETIWHFSGNVSEWVNFEQVLSTPGGVWRDFSTVSDGQFGLLGYLNVGPISRGDMTKGLGGVKNNVGGLGYFARGGSYVDGNGAGIYALETFADPYDNGKTGFRCAK